MNKNTFIKVSLTMLIAVLNLSFVTGDLNKAGEPPFKIMFSHQAGSSRLALDSSVYKNEFAQDFTISKFKYYIGEITLVKKNGASFKGNTYYLVDEAEESSKQIILKNVPPGEYSHLEFIIGVDSVMNCSGAQSGVLDPVNAMFWAWNTGYIFFKMEGRSSYSTSPAHLLEYHIGGYRHPHNCIRKIRLDISGRKEIQVLVDIAKFFGGQTKIDLTKLSSVTDFHNATAMADNYAQMFSVLNEKK